MNRNRKIIIKGWGNASLRAVRSEAAAHKCSRLRIAADMLGCYFRYSLLPFEYSLFNFYGKTAAQRKTYFTYMDRKRMLKKIQSRKVTVCFDDKYVFSKIFSDLYRRPAYRSDLITAEELGSLLADVPRIIYKPLNDKQGHGIRIYESAGAEPETLLSELRACPHGLVEGWIEQSAEMARLYPDAVNCIRVATVSYKDEVSLIGATLTLGTHVSRVANADAGGIFALVDENTGEVISDLVSYEQTRQLLETHPDTGVKMKGYMIPRWDEVKALALEAARRVPEAGFISWDIAMREDGPILIEGNSKGGYRAFQLPGVAPGVTGNKYKFEKYMQ